MGCLLMETHLGLHNETISESPRFENVGILDGIVERAATLMWLIYTKLTGKEFFLG
jgi:hypothetical protein